MSTLRQTNGADGSGSGWSLLSTVSIVLFLLCLMTATFYCFEEPIGSLDSLIYVSLLDRGSQQAFRDAQPICASTVPKLPSECHPIGGSTAVASYSSSEYATFLRFYRVKPLYIWAATAVHRIHPGPGLLALRIISAGSFLMMGLVIALWLQRHLTVPAACLIALLLACMSPVRALGRFLLPDAFSNALMLLILYVVLYRIRRLWLQIALLFVLPLARPDNILLCCAYGALLVYRATPERKTMWFRLGGLVVGCLLLNTILQRATHALSYTILFTHSFLNFSRPSAYPQMHLSLHNYAQIILWSGFKTLVLYFPLPTLFAALALADPTTWRPLRDLVVACTVTAYARLLLFPAQEERYYTWFLIIAVVAAASTLAMRVQAPRSWFASESSRRLRIE